MMCALLCRSMLTLSSVPPHAADIDMFRRAKMMVPPLKEHQWLDVLAVHGKRTDTSYWPGAWLPDDPHVKEEKDLTHFTGVGTERGVVLGCGEVASELRPGSMRPRCLSAAGCQRASI